MKNRKNIFKLFMLAVVFATPFFTFSNVASAACVEKTNPANWSWSSPSWKTSYGGQSMTVSMPYTCCDGSAGGTHTQSCTTGPNNGDTCSVDVSYNDSCPTPVAKSTTATSRPNKVDVRPPVCGSWTQDGHTFTIDRSTTNDSTDTDGGKSGVSGFDSQGGFIVWSCDVANSGQSCSLDPFYDLAGNSKVCTSPIYQGNPALSCGGPYFTPIYAGGGATKYEATGGDPNLNFSWSVQDPAHCSGATVGAKDSQYWPGCSVPGIKAVEVFRGTERVRCEDMNVVCPPDKYESGGQCLIKTCSTPTPPFSGSACNNNIPENNGKAWTEVGSCGSTACTYIMPVGPKCVMGASLGESGSWEQCPNAQIGLNATTTWEIAGDTVSSCGSRKCSGYCNSGYSKGPDGVCWPKLLIETNGGSPIYPTLSTADSYLASRYNILDASKVTLTASGGNGSYTWNSDGGSPLYGYDATFITRYRDIGTRLVTVQSAGQVATIAVHAGMSPTPATTDHSCINNTCTMLGWTQGGIGFLPDPGEFRNDPTCASTCGNPEPTYYTCSGGACVIDSSGATGNPNDPTCANACIPPQTKYYKCSGGACALDLSGATGNPNDPTCGGACTPVSTGNITVIAPAGAGWAITGTETLIGAGNKSYTGKTFGMYTIISTTPGFVAVFPESQTLSIGNNSITFTLVPTSLSCFSNASTVSVGEIVDYAATGGSGIFSWTGGGVPATGGNISSFSTSFATSGNYVVSVSRGASNANCPSVAVSTPPTVSVSLTASPASGMVELISKITATITGTATGIAEYKFWQDCPRGTCSGQPVVINADSNSADTDFTYTVPGTYHPKVTVSREGITVSDSTTVIATPKKYACVNGSCSASTSGAYSSISSCADACMHTECIAESACTSVSADPMTGVGGVSRCSSGSDCPPPKKYGCVNNACVEVAGGAYGDSSCNGACAVIPQRYSCSTASGACKPDPNGQYTDSTCNGICSATYYSCASGSCSEDSNGQFTSSNCDNRCMVVYGACSAATNSCVNTNIKPTIECSNDVQCGCVGPDCGPTHLECVNNACIIANGPGPNGAGCDNSGATIGQYCGGVGKCSLKVSPPLVSAGQSVKISWDCVGSPTCSLTRKYDGANPMTLQDPIIRTKGSYPSIGGPAEKPKSSATYTLSCTNNSASATARVKVSTLIECAPTDPTCKP